MSLFYTDANGAPTPEPEPRTYEKAPTLQEVSRRRAVQTFFVGLGVDLVVVIALLWLSSVDTITNSEALGAFGVTVGKTVITTTAQYILRRFVDISGYNRDGTPKEILPTDPPITPVSPEEEGV